MMHVQSHPSVMPKSKDDRNHVPPRDRKDLKTRKGNSYIPIATSRFSTAQYTRNRAAKEGILEWATCHGSIPCIPALPVNNGFKIALPRCLMLVLSQRVLTSVLCYKNVPWHHHRQILQLMILRLWKCLRAQISSYSHWVCCLQLGVGTIARIWFWVSTFQKNFLPLISWIAFPAICTMTQLSFRSHEYEVVLWTASYIVHLYYFLWERQLPNSFSSMLKMRFCKAGSTCAARRRLALVPSHWELNATLELVCCQAC